MSYIRVLRHKDLAPALPKSLDDPFLGGCTTCEGLSFEGWAKLARETLTGVCIKCEGNILANIPADVPRAKVNEMFHLPEDQSLGFYGKLPLECIGKRFVLDVWATTPFRSFPLWSVEGLREDQGTFHLSSLGKLFFMHIAKTAGSSVNAFCRQYFPGDWYREHIESIRINGGDKKTLQTARYLSGHVTVRDAVHEGYIDGSYVTFTLLRDPIKQLLSHLSWVKRLSFPEYQGELQHHQRHIWAIAQRIGSMPLSDFLCSLTLSEKDIFDNVQTRYLSNIFQEDLKDHQFELAKRQLLRFDVIGINERLSESLQLLSYVMGWPIRDVQSPHENISKYKVSLDDVDERGLKSLHHLTRYDARLYALATNVFASQYRAAFANT